MSSLTPLGPAGPERGFCFQVRIRSVLMLTFALGASSVRAGTPHRPAAWCATAMDPAGPSVGWSRSGLGDRSFMAARAGRVPGPARQFRQLLSIEVREHLAQGLGPVPAARPQHATK